MAKAKTRFVCQDCGHESIRWAGQCGGCGAWNTLVEEATPVANKAPVMRAASGEGTSARLGAAYGASRPQRLSDVSVMERHRLVTGLGEFDRVMGGGVMVGSLTLVAGDPGIGKSTLMTDLTRRFAGSTVLYVTGEESAQQVKLRAQRMGVDTDALFLFPETNVEAILAAAYEIKPDVMIVDSIQTVYRPDLSSAPGSVAQVRESTAALLDVTKTTDMTTFLVGHVTKQGSIAGPRVLEHMVDTVVHFEGDRHHAYRILRAVKNRFGAANEMGVFEMREGGLVEVANPSAL
ncbi:MAG TPA: DNA repair protein RadA, partial [Rubricoccaceae bacterium]